MTICVKTYYNTDENNDPVPDDVQLEDMPITYVGPFETMAEAIDWMNNVYPDGDEDVYEQVADDYDLPEGTYINHPDSLFGGTPEEDIRPEDANALG